MLIEGERDCHGARWDSIVAVGFVPSISETTPMSTFGRVGVTWATISTVNPENPTINNMGFDAAIASGMSGGAVFDVHGHLAGIIHSQHTLGFDHRALRWKEINEALPELRAGATNP
jgi:S1-C subfamily serine protease